MTAPEQYSDRAQYYDIEFNDTSDRKILETIVDSVGGRVLEVPSGSGRNMWLADKGNVDMVFADLSQPMVDQVAEKLTGGRRGVAVQADMTDLSLDVFDLIVVPREGLQLLPKHQLLKALRSFYASLKQEGFVYIDIAKLRPPFFSSNHPEYIVSQDVWHEDFSRHKADIHVARRHRSRLDSGILRVEYAFQVKDGRSSRQFESRIDLTEYSARELSDALRRTGFRIKALYGNYEMKPYEAGDDRMIFLVQKDS